MSADFECVVFIKDRDEGELLSLRSAVWGADHPHTNPSFLRWLFAATPPLEPCGAMVQLNKRTIGFAGICSKRIQLDGRVGRLAHGVDYMIHPDVNGLTSGYTAVMVANRWLQLTRDRHYAVGLVFPNEHSQSVLTSEYVGLKPIFEPVLMVRPLGGIVLKQPLKGAPRQVGMALLRMAAFYGQARACVTGAEADLVGITAFGGEYDELWASMAQRIRVGIVRDSAYLNWRYVDHPVYKYERLSMRSGAGLLGYVVGSPRQTFGVDAMLLVDMGAKASDEGVSLRLIKGLVAHAGRQGRDMVAALTIPRSKMHSALKRCGFLQVPSRLGPRLFRTAGVVLTEGAACASDPAAWYFTWGDTDVV